MSDTRPVCCGLRMFRLANVTSETTRPDADGWLWRVTSERWECLHCRTAQAVPVQYEKFRPTRINGVACRSLT